MADVVLFSLGFAAVGGILLLVGIAVLLWVASSRNDPGLTTRNRRKRD